MGRSLLLLLSLPLSGCLFFPLDGAPPPPPFGCLGDMASDFAEGGGDEDDVRPIVLTSLSPDVFRGPIHVYEDLVVTFDRAPERVIAHIVRPDDMIEVPMVATNEGREVTLDLSEFAAPEAIETLRLGWSESDSSPIDLEIQWSRVGLEPPAGEYAGRVFAFGGGDLELLSPPGVGPILASLMEQPIVIGIDRALLDAERLQARMFMQGACYPIGITQSSVSLWFDGVQAWATPEDHPPETALEGGLVSDVHVSGFLHPDEIALVGVEFSALVDTAPLNELVIAGDTPDDTLRFCTFLSEMVGAQCEPCPETGEPRCLTLRGRVREVLALDVAALPLLPEYVDSSFDEIVDSIIAESEWDPECEAVVPVDCEIPPIEITCNSAAGTANLPWMVLGILAFRRRR